MTTQRRDQARTRTRADEQRRPNAKPNAKPSGKPNERPSERPNKKAKPRAGLLAHIRHALGRLRVAPARPKAGDAATAVVKPRPPTSAAATATDPVALELRQISKQLRQRLDRHALARTVFPQLGIVERELARHGYPVLRSLPVELLHGALEQLACITGQAPGELATLRSKMLDAILARQPKAGDFNGHLALSVFDAPHKLEIREAGESAFLDAHREWMRA